VKSAGVFMNESGKIIREALDNRHRAIENLYIAHDDLDIRLGEYKIQLGTGPKVHNGVISVEQALGTKDFWRVRIGIDNRQTPVEGEDYVLQKFRPEEMEIINGVLEDIADEILKTNS
jgi:peptidyl-tRNA hydrolase, PTH1 family